MNKLVDREKELTELNRVAMEHHSAMIVLKGRRRVGKTALLRHYTAQSKLPSLYWTATLDTPENQFRGFSQAIWTYINGDVEGNPPLNPYANWEQALQILAEYILNSGTKHIVVIDEFVYLIKQNPAIPSIFQKAWDIDYEDIPIQMILCGSYLGMMNDLLKPGSPLHGRGLRPIHLEPLPFRTLKEFFPSWSIEKRIATYSILGGIPYYLNFFSDKKSLWENLEDNILTTTGILRVDPELLILEQTSNAGVYNGLLHAIAAGNTKMSDILDHLAWDYGRHSHYFESLTQMGYIKGEIPLNKRKLDLKRQTRHYRITDEFLRFYFRFIFPNLHMLDANNHMPFIRSFWGEDNKSGDMPNFIGSGTFEDLAQKYILLKGRNDQLPFLLEDVGQAWRHHRSLGYQIDAAGISWQEQSILIAEAKWRKDSLSLNVVNKLIEQGKKIKMELEGDYPNTEWDVCYTFFSKSGFTDPALEKIEQIGGEAVTLERLEDVLAQE